jgi:hypothetical protein
MALKIFKSKNKKKAPSATDGASRINAWQCPTFTWGDPTLSSAQNVFTSEFGMDSGGSHSLLPPGKLLATPAFADYRCSKTSPLAQVGSTNWIESD